MNIINTNLSFSSALTSRSATNYIVLHHRAGEGDINSLHAGHLALGWAGAGYHLYIRKDGSVYQGRPMDKVGAHCMGYNDKSVGVCFEGDLENASMPDAQIKAGAEAVAYLMNIYPAAMVVRHCDLGATLCPGKNFPLDSIKNVQKGTLETKAAEKALTSANDITWELKQKIEISDTNGFVAALEAAKQANSPLYWGFYKIVNQ